MKFHCIAASLALAVSAGGCASVMTGSTQEIAVSTQPVEGALCSLSGTQGNYQVTTPGTVEVERSKNDMAIRCAKAGYQDGMAAIPSNFESWTVGNILIGGIAGVGVDAATGAINEYPHTVTVAMTQAPGGTAAAPPTATMPQEQPHRVYHLSDLPVNN